MGKFQGMKNILFPITARPHMARQQLLIGELRKHFKVVIVEHQNYYRDILNIIADYANWFRIELKTRLDMDMVLIRGDRFEMLPLAMMTAYKRIPIIHIEGGELSGAIDNKVRHAITQLSELHFAISEEGQKRIIGMGISPRKVFNFGSLDVEYAKNVKIEPYLGKPYIVVVFHPIRGESPQEIDRGLEFYQGDIVRIKSNKDEGVQYGEEEYTAEQYINLLANASCLVGNSSSFLKEASIFGTPVVNLGSRQQNRLKPHNVLDVPHVEAEFIEIAIEYQLKKIRYQPDEIYYQPETSKKITEKICEIIK